jgi:hypothetical protein
MGLGGLIPLWTYPVLRKLGKFSVADAGAIAAHYGSVSAVTFIAATNFLKSIHEPFESYASAFLAVMESPAIIVGVMLGKGVLGGGKFSLSDPGVRHALRDAVLGKGVLLLIGAMVIGSLCGKRGMESVEGFFVTPFQGVLALFLLEMGMVAGRRLGDLKKVGVFLLLFGVIAPLVHGFAGVLLGGGVECRWCDLARCASRERELHRSAGGGASFGAGSESDLFAHGRAGHHVSV